MLNLSKIEPVTIKQNHMYLTVHAAAGLVVAQSLSNPFWAFFGGIASHLILDFIPHGDEYLIDNKALHWLQQKKFLGAAIIDAIVMAFFIMIYAITTPGLNWLNVTAALLGAWLPDIMQAVYMVTKVKWLKGYHHWHNHWHNLTGHNLDWKKGMVVQCMVFTAFWLWLM